MGICDRCGADITPLFTLNAWDDQAADRYAYSQILDHRELQIQFPGREVTFSCCRVCYQALTGSPPNEARPPVRSDLFVVRTLQSELATALARGLFEYCGYEVRYSGYEHTTPEWRVKMKSGDPNPAVARVRTTPDLRVYDPEMNTLYDVEVKTTKTPPPLWRYRRDQLDTIRYHYPETILMVYVQPVCNFFAQSLDSIGWSKLPVSMVGADSFYDINLEETFRSPPEVFTLINLDRYESFLVEARTVLKGFGS